MKKTQWQTLPQPQAGKRRQKAPQQQVEKVERKNMERNRKCYNCRGFGHMTRDHRRIKRQTKPR